MVISPNLIHEVIGSSTTNRNLTNLRDAFQADIVVYFALGDLYSASIHGQAYDNEIEDDDHTINESVDNNAFSNSCYSRLQKRCYP